MQRRDTSILFGARLRRALVAARRRHHLVVEAALVLEREAREQRAQVLAARGLALRRDERGGKRRSAVAVLDGELKKIAATSDAQPTM